MFETAATTDGSSTTMGTTTSFAFTRKFTPTASGSPNVPITFSIIMFADSRLSAVAWSAWTSSVSSSATASMAPRRSSGLSR
jgi:hypothetical protein